MSIKVKQCLVSPTTSPKFHADVGNTVLVKSPQGHLDEVEIVSIRANRVECIDSSGTPLDIQPDDILAVFM